MRKGRNGGHLKEMGWGLPSHLTPSHLVFSFSCPEKVDRIPYLTLLFRIAFVGITVLVFLPTKVRILFGIAKISFQYLTPNI